MTTTQLRLLIQQGYAKATQFGQEKEAKDIYGRASFRYIVEDEQGIRYLTYDVVPKNAN